VAAVELRFIEIQQRLREQRVVVQETGNGGIALAIAAQQDSASPGRYMRAIRNSAARRAASA
jgi:hypothetical protein